VSKVLCYRPEKVYTYLAKQVSSFSSGNCTSARSRARNPAVRFSLLSEIAPLASKWNYIARKLSEPDRERRNANANRKKSRSKSKSSHESKGIRGAWVALRFPESRESRHWIVNPPSRYRLPDKTDIARWIATRFLSSNYDVSVGETKSVQFQFAIQSSSPKFEILACWLQMTPPIR